MKKQNRAHRRLKREEQKQLTGFPGLNQMLQSSPTITGAAASVGEEKGRYMEAVQEQMRGERSALCAGCGAAGATHRVQSGTLLTAIYCDDCRGGGLEVVIGEIELPMTA